MNGSGSAEKNISLQLRILVPASLLPRCMPNRNENAPF